MFDTSDQILGFHNSKVVLPGPERTNMRERRDNNRSRLKLGLEANKKPKPIGQHTQGSYAMRTMVQDDETDYDIDDGVYFKKEGLVGANGGEMSSLAVRQMVCAALQDDRFKKPPEVLKNCVRVYYDAGFHVDVPSYRRIETKNAWTGQSDYSYELASAAWKTSDPLSVTAWFKKANESHSSDFNSSDGQFCRIVRLLKKFSRSRNSWKKVTATGFMISKLADECFYASTDRDDISLRETMKAIRWRLQGNTVVSHPTLAGETITKENDPRPGYFREKLVENLQHLEILDKLGCTHADAMAAWDKVFCTDWFSDQPAPDTGGGDSSGGRSAATPTRPVEKKDGGRFATSVPT